MDERSLGPNIKVLFEGCFVRVFNFLVPEIDYNLRVEVITQHPWTFEMTLVELLEIKMIRNKEDRLFLLLTSFRNGLELKVNVRSVIVVAVHSIEARFV